MRCPLSPLTALTQRFTCTQPQLPAVRRRLAAQGLVPILDYAVETRGPTPAAPTPDAPKVRDAAHVLTHAFKDHPGTTFALKWSALGYDPVLADDVVGAALAHDVTVLLDAERTDAHDATAALADRWMRAHNAPDAPPSVYKTYQMYRRDAPAQYAADLLDPTRAHPLGIKLVRGAYLHEERHTGLLCRTAEDTHAQYDEAVQLFARHRRPGDVLMCATHNRHSVAQARATGLGRAMAAVEAVTSEATVEAPPVATQPWTPTRDAGTSHSVAVAPPPVPPPPPPETSPIVFAQLLGMHNDLSHELVAQGYKTYKYVPFGPFWATVPYLVRRGYEHWGRGG